MEGRLHGYKDCLHLLQVMFGTLALLSSQTARGEPLPRPQLKVVPVREFIEGQTATFQCHLPDSPATAFFYRYGTEKARSNVSMGSFVAEFQIPKISPFDEGHYTCGYQHLGVLSPASSSVRVTVLATFLPIYYQKCEADSQQDVDQESLPAPEIKARLRAVLNEETFSIVCQQKYFPTRTAVFQNGRERMHRDLPQCHVGDPKATLSVDPPHTTFAKGDEINMTCASSPPTTRFHLYKDQELWDSMEVPEGQNASTFLLDITGAEFRGNYSCRYNITVEGREISGLSSPSAQIKLIEEKKPETK
ncbi:uncharacterized protein LOC102364379 isoform X2 [Latimeria chalumnae]|uniref:uncharacterized protein LOC102364379 isoform X2 n=1 Tax=Latimeria chalumnae TaxID=7897 RepID=UPI00313B19AD